MKSYVVQYVSYFAILLGVLGLSVTTALANPTYSYKKDEVKRRTSGQQAACSGPLTGFDLNLLEGREAFEKVKKATKQSIRPFNSEASETSRVTGALASGAQFFVNRLNKRINGNPKAAWDAEGTFGVNYLDKEHVEIYHGAYIQVEKGATSGANMSHIAVSEMLSYVRQKLELGGYSTRAEISDDYFLLLDEMAAFFSFGKKFKFRLVARLKKNGSSFQPIHARDLFFELLTKNGKVTYNPLVELEAIRKATDPTRTRSGKINFPLASASMSSAAEIALADLEGELNGSQPMGKPKAHKRLIPRKPKEPSASDTDVTIIESPKFEVNDFADVEGTKLQGHFDSPYTSMVNPVVKAEIDQALNKFNLVRIKKLEAKEVEWLKELEEAEEQGDTKLAKEIEDAILKLGEKIKRLKNSHFELVREPKGSKMKTAEDGVIRHVVMDDAGNIIDTAMEPISAEAIEGILKLTK